MATEFIPLNLKCVERITEDSVRLTLDTSAHAEKFQFTPGQYITFCFNLSDEELRRAYSICSAPHEGKLQVAVKEINNGRVSTHANRQLKIGDTLNVMPPQGNFTFNADPSKARHLVLFAAGSGITPLFSIIKSALAEEPNTKISLFYGNRSKETIMFYQEIDALAEDERLSVYHILSDGSNGTPLFSGRINFGKTTELLYNFVKDDLPQEYYVCGPGGMMQSVQNALNDAGVAKESLHMEYFANPGQEAEKEEVAVAEEEQEAFEGEATVEIILDDDSYTANIPTSGKSILDGALDSGADAPYSCQGGVCTTCRAKLLYGKVRMESNFALTDDELEEGYILTCQAHPTTKNVKISFDE